MSFTFEFKLGHETVKRVTFAGKAGRRELRTSTGSRVGELVLTPNGLVLELDENTANLIAEADFH